MITRWPSGSRSRLRSYSALTNGFLDAANAIATLVATRGALPQQAIVLAAVFNMLGALLVGTAVADTIAGIVTVPGTEAVIVIGSGALGAVLWNLLVWWRGLPSKLCARARRRARRRGAGRRWHRRGSMGRAERLATGRRLRRPDRARSLAADRSRPGVRVRPAQPARAPPGDTSGSEAPSSVQSGAWQRGSLSVTGRTTAQKSMGVIGALLLAAGRFPTLEVPLWAKVGCGAAITLGTALGGWRIVRKVGRGIFHLAPIDGSRQPGRLDRKPSSPPRSWGLRSRPPTSSSPRWWGSAPGCAAGGTSAGPVVRSIGFAWLLTSPVPPSLVPVRSSCGGRSDDATPLVSAGDAGRPRDAPRTDGDHDGGDGGAHRLVNKASRAPRTACGTASTEPTTASASSAPR